MRRTQQRACHPGAGASHQCEPGGAWSTQARVAATIRIAASVALAGPGLLGGGPDVGPFTLFADQAEELHRAGAGGAEPVWGTGVELGDLARLKDEVVLAEDEPECAVENRPERGRERRRGRRRY